jgi:DNA-binding NtrC family response regulator
MSAPEEKPKPTVLMVDDESYILDLMREGLGRDFEIETAASAEEASLLTGTRKYDVIVCDQIMPGENGLQFLMRLAEMQPTARLIMMTGYINPELLSRAMVLAGLSACLLKPVQVAEVKNAINAALAKPK